MKVKTLLLVLPLMVLVIGATGCRKCMCCSATYGHLVCIKGTDTVNVTVSGGPWHSIDDSINYYQNHGFIVETTPYDTLYGNTYSYGSTCGKIPIDDAIKLGNVCVPLNNFGDCN